MTLSQKGAKTVALAACVATVEWMKKAYTLRICTQTRNLSEFFSQLLSDTFASMIWFNRSLCHKLLGSNSTRKMSKVQLFVVEENLNSCGKL